MADDTPPPSDRPDGAPPRQRRQARQPAARPTIERLAAAYFGTCRKLAGAITRLKERAK